jgi:hypothetical protein
MTVRAEPYSHCKKYEGKGRLSQSRKERKGNP